MPTASRWRSPASPTSEIAIEAHRNVLTVKGERKDEGNGEGTEVLYRGIAARAFERRFQLADHVEVVGADAEERPAAHRSQAQRSRGAEAAQDRDHGWRASAKQIEAKTAA